MTQPYEKKDVLVSLNDVCLSFDGKPVLTHINAQVQDIVRPGCVTGQVVGILGPSGIGKCLGRGTPVLLFDGSVKNVEDVREGDLLMGPDSCARRVLALGHGYDQMYEIRPVKGDSFTVNAPHILSLRLCRSKRSKARTDEISVESYIQQSKTYKNRAKLYRTGVNFSEKSVPLDPYLFGLWLGDGDFDSLTITNTDVEVVEAVQEFALASGAETSHYKYGDRCSRYRVHNGFGNKGGVHTVMHKLRLTGAVGNKAGSSRKHIPLLYKANSHAVRLALLAGLVDSDGGVAGVKCFEISSKIKQLADDICYVARSLGFASYSKPTFKKAQTGPGAIYHRVIISGHTNLIPIRIKRKEVGARHQIKNVLHTGLTVRDVGIGEYFGFQLDGDGLFLLGDFTVTHNTQLSRIMTGLQDPTSGMICVGNGKKIPVQAGLVGYVAQNYPLLRHRTVLGNLMVAARRAGLSSDKAKEKSLEYLKMFDLEDKWDVYPAQLSGGQRQRIAIAQQLLCSEHYLILDEPTTGLDPIMKDKVCGFVRQVASIAEENTIFVITHDISAVLTMADTLWVLGRRRDEKGVSLGASIVQTYDLIERGIAWEPDPTAVPAYRETQREIRALFETL